MLLFLLATLSAQPLEPMLIDRVIAVISDQIITHSDVLLETELAWRLPSPVRALRQMQTSDPRQAYIEQTIVYRLTDQVSIYQPSAETIQQRLTELQATFASPEDYEAFQMRHGLSDDALLNTLRMRIAVELYVHRNIDLSSLSARENEAAYFQRYRDWMDVQLMTSDVRIVEPQ